MDPRWEDTSVAHRWPGFLDPRRGAELNDALLGLGVIPVYGRLQPLAVANARIIGLELDAAYLAERPLQFPGAPPIVALDVLADRDRERLGLIGDYYMHPAMVMLVEPPEPLGVLDRLVSPQGIPIRGEMRGTLGPQLPSRLAGGVYLTAGHVSGPPGELIRRIHVRRWRRTRLESFGSVAWSCDPVDDGLPGYDVAVIRARKPLLGLRSHRVAHLGQEVEAPADVTLIGAVSGRRHGQVQGALAKHRDGSGRRSWLNSWMMFPGSIGAAGDSGGAVVTPDGEVLGLLVGGSRVRGTTDFGVLYVQDLESIEREALAQFDWQVNL